MDHAMCGEIPRRIKTRHRLSWALLAVLLWAVPAGAQLTVGDDVSMNLSGYLGYGYAGGFGGTGSSHNHGFEGNAYLTGSYYNPSFLSFNFHPYYSRSQSNTSTGTIGQDTGVDASVNLFSGSHFPGSVSYAKAFSDGKQFGLPGGGGLVTQGSAQSFGIAWSELLPGLPPVFANFGMNSSVYSALGTKEENHNSSKFFNLNSNYRLRGFDLAGSFAHQTQSYSVPSFLGATMGGGGTSNSYSFSAQHALPLRGHFGAGWGHSSYSSDGGTDGSSDNLNAGVGFSPWSRLNIYANTFYNSNLSAALAQNLAGGEGLALVRRDFHSQSFRIGSGATVGLPHGITINGEATRTILWAFGKEYTYSQYGGSLSYRYTRPLFGMLYFSFGLFDRATQQGNSGLSFFSNVGLQRNFGRWETSADFGYSQDVQTLYNLAATSSYTYGGSLRRKINPVMYWSGSFRAAHSGLVQVAGSNNGSESISSNFVWRRYGIGGGYGQSHGLTVFTSSGLITPSPGVGLFTDDFMTFNGHSLSVSVNATLTRRLIVTSSYSKSRSSEVSSKLHSLNGSEIYRARAEYRVRKLSIMGEFDRLDQEINTTSGRSILVNSYFVRVTRSFNVF